MVTRQRGYAMFMVLFLAFVIAVVTAGLVRLWNLDVRRDKERELVWIGQQFRKALGSYAAVTPAGRMPFPKTLQELVEDKRFDPPLKHLRRVYLDPMTRGSEWGLVRASDGLIRGVYSQSDARPLREVGLMSFGRRFPGAKRYADWRFEIAPFVVLERPASGAGASP